MSRDHRKLRVFVLADQLVIAVYRASAPFPDHEKYGLRRDLRRAAVSAAVNIVEGCARRTTNEYLNFLNIAAGSAAEARYLSRVCDRLHYLTKADAIRFEDDYRQLCAGLNALIDSLSEPEP